jgi:formiminoglutamase
MNRAPEDIGRDGVIKEYTVFGEKVWDTFPDQAVIDELMRRYYYPYHERLSGFKDSGAVLGLDCHTMLEIGPETALDEGARRPLVCIGTGDGMCPAEWIDLLVAVLTEQFGDSVTINRPFSGGHITRSHAREMPWVQLEISRESSLNAHQKRIRLVIALSNWCRRAGFL